MNGGNHTIHVFAKMRPIKEYVKQTSKLKFRIVIHVIKYLTHGMDLNLLKVSEGQVSFSYFKVSSLLWGWVMRGGRGWYWEGIIGDDGRRLDWER